MVISYVEIIPSFGEFNVNVDNKFIVPISLLYNNQSQFKEATFDFREDIYSTNFSELVWDYFSKHSIDIINACEGVPVFATFSSKGEEVTFYYYLDEDNSLEIHFNRLGKEYIIPHAFYYLNDYAVDIESIVNSSETGLEKLGYYKAWMNVVQRRTFSFELEA